MAVGISINDFNEMKELEVMTFRRNILEVCKEVVACRDDPGGHNRALYTYPPEVESSSIPPSHVQSKLNKGNSMHLSFIIKQSLIKSV